MGLTRGQVLVRVELPLAVPAIIGGLRIAVVSTVAIATIAAFLAARRSRLPDLPRAEGTRRRSRRRSTRPVLLAVALALACDLLLVAIRRVAQCAWRRVA